MLGADLPDSASSELVGDALADILRGYMQDLAIPNGLSALGADRSRIEPMAEAATFYLSTDKVAPRRGDKEAIAKIYEDSMKVY